MTITLEIPAELESELVHEAQQLGLSLPEYTLRVLYARPLMETPIKTGSDLVAYWENTGLLGTRTELVDSAEHSRQLRTEAENRTRDSHN